MKQLLPKPSSEADPRLQPSSTTSLTSLYHGPKRRASAVKAACSRCRASRSKCDGQRPTCARCANRGYECVFDVQQGLTRQKDLRLKFETLKSERDQLQSILIQMRDGEDEEAQEILRVLREAGDMSALLPDGSQLTPSLFTEGSDVQDMQGISPRSGSPAGDEVPLSAASSVPATDQWSELPFSGSIDGEWMQSSPRTNSFGNERSQGELTQSFSSSSVLQPSNEGQRSKDLALRGNKRRSARPIFVLPPELPKAGSSSRNSRDQDEKARDANDRQTQNSTMLSPLANSNRVSQWVTYVQEQQLKSLHSAMHLRPPPFIKVNPTSTDVGHIMSFWEIDFVDRARHRISMGDENQSLHAVLGPALPNAQGFLDRLANTLISEAEDVQTWARLCLQEVQGLRRVEYCASVLLNTWVVRWLIFPCEATYREIPTWLRPTPTEIFTPHLPIYNTVPWVGIRESLIDNPADIVSILAHNISVNWPHPIQDIFLQDPNSGESTWNPGFLAHVRDLDNWSLHPSVLHSQPHWATLAKFSD